MYYQIHKIDDPDNVLADRLDSTTAGRLIDTLRAGGNDEYRVTAYYEERIGRYRIVRHEELPEEHKAAKRLHGDDPDDSWSLIWSFDEKDDAIEQLMRCREGAPWWETYKFVDGGEPLVIKRPSWM